MVGMPRPTDPVADAQAAVQNPGSTVLSALQSLKQPPLNQIPFVHDPSAKPGCWAQCIAMVQDIWDAELFVATSPDRRSGLLVENAAASENPAARLAERLPVYLVSLPGQSTWARATRPSPAPAPAAQPRTKRPRDDTDADMPDQPAQPAQPSSHPPPSPTAAGSSSAAGQEKRARASSSTASAADKPAPGLGLNLPLPGQRDGAAVVAKLYDDAAGKALRVNTVVHVVGVLQEALPMCASAAEDAAFAEEFAARNPSNVKRLHIVSLREAAEWELNPATAALGAPALPQARAELKTVLPAMRDLAIRYLASALFGDMLAAEYLLLCLLSRPAQRTGAGTALGKLSVNLIVPNAAAEAQPSFVRELGEAIGKICPAVVPIDLSIAALNAKELYPRKDYSLNRLRAAPLQLAAGSVLLADETGLSDGRLAERGVKNVRALTKVAQSCSAPIDFQYYEADLPVRCCTVIVSRGGKSIIGSDVVVRVRADDSLGLRKWSEYGDDLVNKLRLAFALLAEHGTFDIGDEASKAVENEYVKARRSGAAKDGHETLQGWLGVARCCARSFGEDVLGLERWRYAWQLEQRRCARARV